MEHVSEYPTEYCGEASPEICQFLQEMALKEP